MPHMTWLRSDVTKPTGATRPSRLACALAGLLMVQTLQPVVAGEALTTARRLASDVGAPVHGGLSRQVGQPAGGRVAVWIDLPMPPPRQ